MACTVGANLNCGKADTRRDLPGATAWCRENPDSDFIPMFATGHETIYDWRCTKGQAVRRQQARNGRPGRLRRGELEGDPLKATPAALIEPQG